MVAVWPPFSEIPTTRRALNKPQPGLGAGAFRTSKRLVINSAEAPSGLGKLKTKEVK
jgi:hypothetical protein